MKFKSCLVLVFFVKVLFLGRDAPKANHQASVSILNGAMFKTLMTFHYTDWFIGILLMAYYNPYISK